MFRCSLEASWFYLALALILAPAALVSGQEVDSEVSRHFLDARKAQASGDLKLAAQEYTAVIRLQPDLAEARVNLGLVYYLEARYAESAEALEKALSIKPDLRGADLFLGIDLVKLGQPRRAVSYLKQAVAEEPNNKQARTWLGNALWDAGDESVAILELRAAAKIFPTDPDILFLLGQAYRNAGNEDMDRVLTAVGTPLYHQAYGDIYKDQHAWKPALGHYQRALEKDPKWPGAHLGLGEVYLRQGELDKARSEFLAERTPGSTIAAATAQRAQIALRQEQPEEALHLLNEAIQAEPDAAACALGLPPLPFTDNVSFSEDVKTKYRQSAKVLQDSPSSPARSLALAFVDLQLGLRENSAREWQRYRTAMPFPSPAGNDFERAVHEFERHDFDDARSHLIAFISAHPHDASARYLLARTSHSLSLSVLADMLSSAPDSPRTHQLMGQALAERGENGKALAEYRTVEAAAPTLGGVHFAIGELLWKVNQADAAMAEFQQELHLNPAHAEASAAAGTILVHEHQADQAIPFLERALQLRPSLLTAHQELGKALYQRREFLKAEAELRKALADDPVGSVHYLLATVYKQLGQNEEATAAFAESRRIKAERLNAVNMESGEQ